MKYITHTVKNKLGLHARTAVGLASISRETESRIFLQKGMKRANCREVFSLMNLGVKYGEVVTFSIEGIDEAETLKSIEAYCRDFL